MCQRISKPCQVDQCFVWDVKTEVSCAWKCIQGKSVCPSARPFARSSVPLSVTPFSLFSHRRIIMRFSGVITTEVMSMQKVKVKQVQPRFSRFRIVTPVRIHIWRWNDADSYIWLRWGALLFFMVICQILRSHCPPKKSSILTKIGRFRTATPILNSQMAMKWCAQLEVAYKMWPVVYSSS